MGIDKIGKNAGVQDTTGAGASEGAAPVERSFAEVHAEKTARSDGTGASATAGASAADATAGTSPLERLKAGQLDVDGYVDARIDQATQGLKGLGASQLTSIRMVLREQMLTDPGLSDLVRQATGQAAKAPEE